ncbi:MAG: hypothetical protein SGBAC_010853 [Bacillariaceae sp.]
MQSFLHDLLQDHHALANDVAVVQDNAKILKDDSSSSMMILLQQQDSDNWAAYGKGTEQGRMGNNNGISRWEHQEPIRHGSNKLPNDTLFKKSKKTGRKHAKKMNPSSLENKKSAMDKPNSNSTEETIVPFSKKSLRRSISDSKHMQDNLRKRARELLLATSGGFGSTAKDNFTKKSILRRNSWSHDKLPLSRDWEENSDAQLPVPVRRTSGEMSAEFKWDDGTSGDQRQYKSLEFTLPRREVEESTTTTTTTTTKKKIIISAKYKDTSLKIPSRGESMQDTDLFDQDQEKDTASHLQEALEITAM